MTAPALRPLEVASGLVIGAGPKIAALDTHEHTPREALERAVLTALRRPPCVVSFSGGRDSSAVLALATHVARREGLPLPVPVTNRFPSVAETDEDEWQERVVRHLKLREWVRIDHGDDLDCVGTVAAAALRRHGLLWPFNAHFHVPVLRVATTGSLLTGIGGDELLSTKAARVNDVLRARVRPETRDLLRVGFALSPMAVRRRVLRRRPLPLELAWLKPHARAAVVRTWADDAATEPMRWAASVWWVRRLRYIHVGTTSVRVLAADVDVGVVHPFLDRRFVRAVAALSPRRRFTDRTAAMHELFADLLPRGVIEREEKASFDGAFWSAPSRAFAAEWAGQGVDAELVDVDALRAEWASPRPDPRSFTLAQSAWLASAASTDSVTQARDGVREGVPTARSA